MFWKLIAKIVSRPAVANWLIKRAMKTPYTHIIHDGSIYMERYWLFNSYSRGPDKQERSKYPWFPWNIRIHWIKRPDNADHLHDHPWNARTIILRGGYAERREGPSSFMFKEPPLYSITRRRGDTAKINFGEYHEIHRVLPGGAWTLFISGPYRGRWGFLVDGVKVPYREYFAPGKAGLIDPNEVKK